MKKGIFLLLGMMSLATISANSIEKSTGKIGVNYRYNDVVTFVERGIQFHVFLNGDFDFDTHYNEPRYVDYYGRRTRTNRGVRIEKDYRGRVRRIGNVFINYDRRGNVKRIGSVYMRYRFGQLTDVGNLQIEYDRYGYPRFYGNVKRNGGYYYNDGFNIDINIGDIYDYDDEYFYRRDFKRNYRQFREDDDFLYYRANPKARVDKRNKFIKRRKIKKDNDNYRKNNRRILKPEQRTSSKRDR